MIPAQRRPRSCALIRLSWIVALRDMRARASRCQLIARSLELSRQALEAVAPKDVENEFDSLFINGHAAGPCSLISRRLEPNDF
jgi:hypothetical protein